MVQERTTIGSATDKRSERTAPHMENNDSMICCTASSMTILELTADDNGEPQIAPNESSAVRNLNVEQIRCGVSALTTSVEKEGEELAANDNEQAGSKQVDKKEHLRQCRKDDKKIAEGSTKDCIATTNGFDDASPKDIRPEFGSENTMAALMPTLRRGGEVSLSAPSRPGAIAHNGVIQEGEVLSMESDLNDLEVGAEHRNDGERASHGDFLVSATLVGDREEGMEPTRDYHEFVTAEKAYKGFKAIAQNKRFKYVVVVFFVTLIAIVVPIVCYAVKQAKKSTFIGVGDNATTCGTWTLRQIDYRGTISVTKGGLTCQRWDSQSPHPHGNIPGRSVDAGLEENYCRNPDGDSAAWCYTTDPEVRFQYCDVPYCDFAESTPTSTYCGTLALLQEDYVGTINVTATGKPCRRWDSLLPHDHQFTNESAPFANLQENYCRNPDQEPGAWCYTMDSATRWEPCDVTPCVGIDVGIHENHNNASAPLTSENMHGLVAARRTCGTRAQNQTDYRGAIAVTETGKTCRGWESSTAREDGYTRTSFPFAGLVGNFCRNPDPTRHARAWCYTLDSDTLPEYCDIPDCEEEEEHESATLSINTTCGFLANRQQDYRGTMNMTREGDICQTWASQVPHAHKYDPANKVSASFGLEANYCRNPDGDTVAWCYTANPEVLWAYCDVPVCELKKGVNW